MKPLADEALTTVELEVVQILRNFPKLVFEAESRRLPDFLRWGARRRRSALDDSSGLLEPPPPPPPPPPPSISPPPDGNNERKDEDRGGTTLSPATPFSFPASGSEEPDGRPPRPLCSPPAKKFKKTNRHMEWVQEQNLLIGFLSDQKARLQRSIAEHEALYQKLKEKNSWLQELRSKMTWESMAKEGQRQWQEGSFGLARLHPTTLQSPATCFLMDPPNQRWEIQPPPPSVDRIVGSGSPSPSTAATGRWTEKRVALDLNASPQEEEDVGKLTQSAMSSQARKRKAGDTTREERRLLFCSSVS